jgi:hypothetical protein
MFENSVLRRIFGSRRDDVTGSWRNAQIKEDMRWRCSSNGRRGMHVGYSWQSQKDRDR